MRIFCVVRHSHDPRQFFGGLWSANFYPALERLGHQVIESQVDLLPASRFLHVAGNFTREELHSRGEITQRIVDEVAAEHRRQPIDLFLGYLYNSHFDPAGFDDLHRLGIPTVNFYCNSIYQFELVSAIAGRVQWSWHAEKHARASYLAAGARPVWVQMAADPNLYRPIAHATRAPGSCFVGQRYADRDRLVASLVKAGVPVDVFGGGWAAATDAASISSGRGIDDASATDTYLGRKQFAAGSVASYANVLRDNLRRDGWLCGTARTFRQWHYRRESRRTTEAISAALRGFAPNVCETFSRYEVVLNFSHVWADGRPGSRLIPHVRLRDFEAPMCRTCFLTGHTDEIAEFYDIGREIDTYRTPEELVEKTRFYLRHADAAERLRNAGHLRARRDHTWERRFEQLFQAIGLHQPAAVA